MSVAATRTLLSTLSSPRNECSVQYAPQVVQHSRHAHVPLLARVDSSGLAVITWIVLPAKKQESGFIIKVWEQARSWGM